MQKIRWGILLTGIVVLIAAMLQNSNPVPLKLFFYETQLPTAVVLLVTAAISFLLGILMAGRMYRRSGKSADRAKTTKTPPAVKSAEPAVPQASRSNPFST